tara:strand:- start:114 stop:260 length:147 start_codon:yes stop_codon:yes gene_type:complete
LAKIPFLFEQMVPLEHVFVADMQYKPEIIVQPVAPQRHGALFEILPST